MLTEQCIKERISIINAAQAKLNHMALDYDSRIAMFETSKDYLTDKLCLLIDERKCKEIQEKTAKYFKASGS
jgi:hypothetical protein